MFSLIAKCWENEKKRDEERRKTPYKNPKAPNLRYSIHNKFRFSAAEPEETHGSFLL